MLSYADAHAKTGCANVETTVWNRRILFAGLVASMDNERLPKRVMFGGVDGGTGHSGGQEQDWMGCLEHDLSLLACPPKRNTARWQRRSRVSRSDGSRKRQSIT